MLTRCRCMQPLVGDFPSVKCALMAAIENAALDPPPRNAVAATGFCACVDERPLGPSVDLRDRSSSNSRVLRRQTVYKLFTNMRAVISDSLCKQKQNSKEKQHKTGLLSSRTRPSGNCMERILFSFLKLATSIIGMKQIKFYRGAEVELPLKFQIFPCKLSK